MGKGSLRKRGADYWELKFDIGPDPLTGERRIRYESFRGGKRAAQARLAEIVASLSRSEYIEPSKLSVAALVRSRIDQWEASEAISPRTADRYRQLCEHQFVKFIGGVLVQKLRPLDIEKWHAELKTDGRARGNGGVAPRSIRHAHRVLAKALDDAMRNDIIQKNVCRIEAAPHVEAADIPILSPVAVNRLIDLVRGEELYPATVLALFTGMRLGEVLALRWSNVDLDMAGTVSVIEALEESRTGIRFKKPKTRAGIRDVTLPSICIEALRDQRRKQLELRLQLGWGKLPGEALVFPDCEGEPQSPSRFSRAWGLLAARIGMPEITFHGLRHCHASQLISAGVDIAMVARRLGHANPSITLQTYSHLFAKDDRKAAQTIDEALSRPVRP